MVFSDLFFLFVFIPAFILCYLLGSLIDRTLLNKDVRRTHQARNIALVVFSLIFYAWGEPVYVFLMLCCVLANYIIGLLIDRQETHRKAALIIGLIVNIGILGVFKYANFFAETLQLTGLNISSPNIALPIGISFYTFQSISYLIDVYRKESPVQHRFIDLLLYISMFPQLIAGPIVRYGTIADNIHKRHASAQDIAYGIQRFLIGLGKKVILANQLSELSDLFLKNNLDNLSVAGSWMGIIAFTLQIYFDFSGYSDMAIGMGRCLGFKFNENFNHPYCCNSITDFWRRWHISLGSFFRDYLYIPLGGNRRHQALNILIVWFLTGMWHGASWNFIIWGMYFGLIVMVEKYTLLKIQKYIPDIILHIYSMLLVIIGWGIFYFDDFSSMVTFFNALVGNAKELTDLLSETALFSHFWLWITAIILCLPVFRGLSFLLTKCVPNTTLRTSIDTTAKVIFSIAVLILSTALLVGATNNAFIYTRF
ncbi:MAG: MBOAT family protein [Bacteroidaceae bacterium]|nr:MBOAT family protein [Bacteroidaceae bacterium]